MTLSQETTRPARQDTRQDTLSESAGRSRRARFRTTTGGRFPSPSADERPAKERMRDEG